jgi:hypothetical protein
MNHLARRPASYHEALLVASIPGGVLWEFGLMLYKQVVPDVHADESYIEEFMRICPPFRAACHALVMGWFNGSLKPQKPDEPCEPGRNDLLMATYLPYCGRFVTNDWPQKHCLREVSAEARLDCRVICYEEFSQSFELAV